MIKHIAGSSLEEKLEQMNVQLSKLTRDLLNLKGYNPGSPLPSNPGVRIGHLIASQLITDILSSGYVVVGMYTLSELNQSVSDAEQRYGAGNVHVLSLANLTQINDGTIGSNLFYMFARRELVDGGEVDLKEALIRMFAPPN